MVFPALLMQWMRKCDKRHLTAAAVGTHVQETTVCQLFDFAIRHLGLLLPHPVGQKPTEQDKQFTAALLHYLVRPTAMHLIHTMAVVYQ
jgi:hypothetical protein